MIATTGPRATPSKRTQEIVAAIAAAISTGLTDEEATFAPGRIEAGKGWKGTAWALEGIYPHRFRKTGGYEPDLGCAGCKTPERVIVFPEAHFDALTSRMLAAWESR
jgi:hypothetical protein